MVINSSQKILFVSTSTFVSGAEISMFEFLRRTNHSEISVVVNKINQKDFKNIPNIILISFAKLYKTYNPLKIVYRCILILLNICHLIKIINNRKVELIYANTFKSAFFVILSKILKKKIVVHLRDNFNKNWISNYILKQSDFIIGVSNSIIAQIPASVINKKVIYGGINIALWKPDDEISSIKKITSSPIVIACIGQITRWKNQMDFIRIAKIISEKNDDIIFMIIGDDLSGREKKYKNELLKLMESLDLHNKIQFLGHQKDIKEVMTGIAILVHPAINEPFGRVLIEAMAIEKPVIAYNCGGPSEIVIDGETGYLAEPHNFEQLADRTMQLINDKELRISMGKAGRQRVVEMFNIERYVREMEDVFDNI